MSAKQRLLAAYVILLLFVVGTTPFSIKTIRNIKKKAAAAGVMLGIAVGSPIVGADDQCTSTTSPISGATIDSCRRVGIVKGRLRGCGSSENCFSTTATAAGKYTAPWLARSELSTEEIWKILKTAVQESGLKVLQDKDVDGSKDRYMLAAEKGDNRDKQPAGSSLFYEFLLRADDKLVLQRAHVDKTVFLYPLQQPVSDFGALKSRLDEIQTKSGLFRTQTD